jgi:uncharacterized protein (DUF952 family)
MILHIIARAEWDEARRRGEVTAPSLATAGFVHCSDPGTVHMPAGALYAGRTDLVLLEIDPARLGVPLRWEPGDPADPAGAWFPHVYGPIPAAAVTAVHDYPPNEAGGFTLPPALGAVFP